MLERLQLFRSIGQFDAVSSGAQIALAPLTLGFAENGRGKTTLAAILRSLGTNDPLPIMERRRLGASNAPHVVIDTGNGQTAIFQNGAWSRSLPDIAVFDDEFVNENVYSGLAVDSDHRQNLHELILGSQGIALGRALQTAIDAVESANRTLRNATDAIPQAIRGGFTVEAFCALPARADSDQAIIEAEKQLAAANAAQSVAKTSAFDQVTLPPFDESGLRELLDRTLDNVAAAALTKVQKHLEQIGPDAEKWVSDGVNRIYVQDTTEHCPFCEQSLTGLDIISHYRTYFSAEYIALKADIEAMDATISISHFGDAQTQFLKSTTAVSQRVDFWRKFTGVPDVVIDTDAILTAWTNARNAVLAVIRRKERAPLERIVFPQDLTDALAAYNDARNVLGQQNAALQTANPGINVAKEQAATANAQAIQATLSELRGGKIRHTTENSILCDAYHTAKQAKAHAEAARDAARQALDAHRTAVFPAYQTAINVYLQRFNAGFTIDQIVSTNTRTGSSCTYNVLVNNHPVAVSGAVHTAGNPSFKTALSAGDRNTLALAFFFASLDQDLYRSDKIVVIDDPITSLDDHRALTTVQEIRRLVDDVAQVIILSHNKPFLCNVWESMASNPRAALEVTRGGIGSTIQPWDVNRDCITLHDKNHELLQDYLTRARPNAREVAIAIRPILEHFLRVSFPADFRPGQMLGPFRGICQQRVGGTNQILDQTDITELRDLTDYANRFHHDTNRAYLTEVINDAELLNFVRRTLTFARR